MEVKCLRCGRLMNSSDKYCKNCHHYYESNLKNNKKNVKRDEFNFLKKIYILILSLIFLPIVSFVIFGIVFSVLDYNYKNREVNNSNEIENYTKDDYNYCNIRCENSLKSIKDNKCICSNGNEYYLESK